MTDTSAVGGSATMLSTQSTAPNHDEGNPLAGGAKSRPKAGDYDGPIRRILDTAIHFYHALLLTEIPFPGLHVEVQWAKSAWDLSCEFYGSDATHNPTILKLASYCLI